jgi:hypothetical protein
MKTKVTGTIQIHGDMLFIPLSLSQAVIDLINEQEGAKYPYTVEIKQERPKKTLSQNNYAWLLIGKIAKVMKTSNDEVYESMLMQYSDKFTHYIMPKEAVAYFQSQCRRNHQYARELNDMQVEGKAGVQLQIFYGSSDFDTKQMNRFIEGIVYEAKDLGIETKTLQEIALLNI